jgi:hypothetical protein
MKTPSRVHRRFADICLASPQANLLQATALPLFPTGQHAIRTPL